MREKRVMQHPRVLVVEDDAAVNRVLRLSLKCGGFDTERAESGGEALQAMGSDFFDAVVLDLGLPDNMGGAVLEELQSVNRGSLPVWVVMSALDEDEATQRYGPLRGPFLPKPFDPWQLNSMLRGMLGGRRRLRRLAS